MRIFKRKSQLERLRSTVDDRLPTPLHLPARPSSKTLKTGLIAAGGLTGLTVGSAGISSLRRRIGEAEDDS